MMNVFAQKQDTLYTKGNFLSTYVYKDSIKLPKRQVIELFKDTWQPNIKHKWSKFLNSTGPLVVIGGIGLTYVAVKGSI